MYLSLNWLKDFVKIPSSITPEEVGAKLTLHTVEVEGVIRQGEKFKNIVVGKILEVNPHPNADRLRLAKVEVGKDKILDIVCGAPNIEPGQLVPVALVGAVMTNGLEIKEAEVRGEKSQGMLCAEDELGLGDGHAGIMILENRAKVGQSFSDYLGVTDVVLEVDNKSLSNRPDLWSHYGIARELSVLFDVNLKERQKIDLAKTFKIKKEDKKINFSVEIKDEKLCPRYMAVGFEGIKITTSPKWMQDRLIAVGMRPINNIVDITNYVMLELGQPLHAFDAKLINGVVVRRANSGEEIETLDGEKRKLDDSMLVIADKNKAIAIAGVMGGGNSEVSDQTESIILEAANFEPVQIRKTSTKLSLRTEASMRFEKSLDPNLCELAVARVWELLQEICPGSKIASDLIDVKKFSLNQGPLELDLAWVNKIIGQEISDKKIIEILEKLGFATTDFSPRPLSLPAGRQASQEKGVKKKVLRVIIPTWRATKDISISEDLVEEIARVYGYNNIKTEMPLVKMEYPRFNFERLFERKVKEILAKGTALTEVYNYSFVSEEQIKKLRIDFSDYIKLANPISNLHTLLRQSLLPNMLENNRSNQARYEKVAIFEIGSVFFNTPGDINKDDEKIEMLPYQEKKLGILVSGDKRLSNYNRAKGILAYLLKEIGLSFQLEESERNLGWAEAGSIADVLIQNKNIGYVAILDGGVGKNFGLKKDLAYLELSMKDLFELAQSLGASVYQELPKFPPVVRDLAFVVEGEVLYNKIKQEIEKFNPLVKSVELFDVYQGEKLGYNKKNLAFHVIYQADRTLTGEEVDKIQDELAKKLEEKFGAVVRNF